MCNFFSCVALRTGAIHFCEVNEHQTLISRLGLRDDEMGYFVRVEVRPEGNGWGPVVVDGTAMSGWWSEDQAAWEDCVLTVAQRVRSAQAVCDEAICAAQAVYNEARHPAWAVYEEAIRPAQAVCDEARRAALAVHAVYDEAMRPAWAVYNEATRAALAVYNEARRPALAVCNEARRAAQDVYVREIQTIEGYVPRPQEEENGDV